MTPEINLKPLADLIDAGLKAAVPIINDELQTLKIQIPTNLFDIFTLSDLSVSYHDGYIEAGLTPTFIPTKGYSLIAPPDVSKDEAGNVYKYTQTSDEDGTFSSNFVKN